MPGSLIQATSFVRAKTSSLDQFKRVCSNLENDGLGELVNAYVGNAKKPSVIFRKINLEVLPKGSVEALETIETLKKYEVAVQDYLEKFKQLNDLNNKQIKNANLSDSETEHKEKNNQKKRNLPDDEACSDSKRPKTREEKKEESSENENQEESKNNDD
jgi:hypothetical protein